MGKVYTTNEDLTNIANAIRAKTGDNGSLVYPTEFISAIGNISTGSNDVWDGYGRNPVLLYTYNQSLKLSDTNWENITLSTTSQKIVNSTTLSNVVTYTENYTYLIIIDGYVNYQYNDNTIYPRPLQNVMHKIFGSVPVTSNINNFSNFSSWSSSTWMENTMVTKHYYSKNNQERKQAEFSNNFSGLFFQTKYPTFYSPYISLDTPPIATALSSDYFTQNTADAIDIDKTTINYTIQIYQYDRLTTYVDNLSLSLFNYYNSINS